MAVLSFDAVMEALLAIADSAQASHTNRWGPMSLRVLHA
jgi:hypothetical protein